MRTGASFSWVKAWTHALVVGAAALILFVTFSPANANDATAVLPLPVPDDIANLRAQPAFGATFMPPAAGQQRLTDELLANYVKRQQQLRSVEVTPAGPRPELNTELLMGYIARGSLGGGNTALSAIASITAPAARKDPTVTPDLLADYIANSYQPTPKRIEVANSERECLAQAIYHEARGESLEGQLAVANIIVNRARSGRFPASLCGVVYQNAEKGYHRCQFTFACDGRSDVPNERQAWARSLQLAERVYAEYATGEDIGAIPDSALFYHTTAVRPNWSSTYTRVAAVGAHYFYAP